MNRFFFLISALLLLAAFSFARPRTAQWTVNTATNSAATNKSVTGVTEIRQVMLTNPNSSYVCIECASSPSATSKGSLIARLAAVPFSTEIYDIFVRGITDFVVYESTAIFDVVNSSNGVTTQNNPNFRPREIKTTILYEQ